MADETQLKVQEKQELDPEREKTVPGKYYLPSTDIYESGDALVVTMEVPGVEKDAVDVRLEKNVLSIEGRIDFTKYENLQPLYTEYTVGHYSRSFSLSSQIDRDKISAKVEDGVLTLLLPKIKEAAARRIDIS